LSSPDTHLVLISGSVGVGKTSVGQELSAQLEHGSISHTFVDLDNLAQTYPRPEDDPFGQILALENLKTVWSNAQTRGVQNLVITRVIESAEGARRVADTVGARRVKIVQLTASDDTLLQRVRRREIGSGRSWHEIRALELSEKLSKADFPDLFVNTDQRPPRDIAREILEACNWL
jgi:gluconate kinase